MNSDFIINSNKELFFFLGPCVIESENLALQVAEKLLNIKNNLDVNIVFKSSFDKANRTSINGYRGLGLEEGLRILEKVKSESGLPVITDVHEIGHIQQVAEVVDVLQTPAFLCRQTDFITKVAETGLPVNIKKGQFLSPGEMQHVITKAMASGNNSIMACERGTSFGYNNLVVDMRGLQIMRDTCKVPIVFDATHSVQQPGLGNGCSLGQRQFVPALARAAVAVGINGVFMETHPEPEKALSDGPNSIPLDEVEGLLSDLIKINEVCISKEKV